MKDLGVCEHCTCKTVRDLSGLGMADYPWCAAKDEAINCPIEWCRHHSVLIGETNCSNCPMLPDYKQTEKFCDKCPLYGETIKECAARR